MIGISLLNRAIMRNAILASIGAAFGITLAATEASSGSAVAVGLATCTTTNCRAKTIQGLYTSSNGLAVGQAWVYQFYAQQGDCLRLDVVSQTSDTEMALVSPNPATGNTVNFVWADDDLSGGLRPLIKVDPVPRTGYYTLVLSRFSASAVNASFGIKYGRYNSGNMNCASPSPLPDVPRAQENKVDNG